MKHDKKCKEYLNVQAELSATVRAELSAMYRPSCPLRAELSTGRVVRETSTGVTCHDFDLQHTVIGSLHYAPLSILS